MVDHLTQLKETPEFAEEMLVAEIQSALEQLLHASGFNRTDLAERMGVSKARVTQIFSDQQNFTVRLLARALHAMGARIRLTSHADEGGLTMDWLVDKGVEFKSAQNCSRRASRWEGSNGAGELIDMRDASTLNESSLAGDIQAILEQYSDSDAGRASTRSNADSKRSSLEDWSEYGGNVVAMRKGSGHG